MVAQSSSVALHKSHSVRATLENHPPIHRLHWKVDRLPPLSSPLQYLRGRKHPRPSHLPYRPRFISTGQPPSQTTDSFLPPLTVLTDSLKYPVNSKGLRSWNCLAPHCYPDRIHLHINRLKSCLFS